MTKSQTQSPWRVEVDTIGQARWSELLRRFADASIYQTWSYESAVHPRCKVSRVVIYDGRKAIGLAQAVIARMPFVGHGMAYFQSAPIWKLRDEEPRIEHLRACLDVIYREYVLQRRLLVRMKPRLTVDEEESVMPAFAAAQFHRRDDEPRGCTIIVDLSVSLEELRKGMHGKWRNCLNSALAKSHELHVGEGCDEFKHFTRFYNEMLGRKQLVTTTSLNAFRNLQLNLANDEKMKVILCGSGGAWHTGAVISTIGRRGIYLFGATTGQGLKDHSAYLVQWEAIGLLKAAGCLEYDLNGINPETNPTVYRFKSRLAGANGRELERLGTFEGCLSRSSRVAVEVGDHVVNSWRNLKTRLARAPVSE
jgi:hypothetical protein